MSPASTIPPAEAERSVLDAADGLFYAHGVTGVGMAEIRDAAGVSLRRLYVMYPSKHDLVAAWLTDRHARWMEWFTASIERHRAGGTDALLAAFDALAEWAHTPGYRGCAFLNSLAEASAIDDQHRRLVASHKQAVIGHLATLAARDHAGAPDWVPAALGVLIDGAITQSVVFGDDTPITAARRAAEHLLEDNHGPHGAGAVALPRQDARRRAPRRR